MHTLKATFSTPLEAVTLHGDSVRAYCKVFSVQISEDSRELVGGADDVMHIIGMMAAHGFPWLTSVEAL